MKTWRYVACAAVALMALLPPQGRCEEPKKAEWSPVFNGKDLDGWKQQGKGVFTVEDGCLVGTQTDGNGGDLFTVKEYDNFEMRFTYKMVWPANSGIWYRTGYQYDILKWKNPVAFSGTLYPGVQSTFLFVNLEEKLENRDGWNEGQVYANGDHLIQWLNGTKIGEARDKRFAKGKVGIQVHGGGGFKNMKILVKKIELRPLAADEGPTPPVAPAAAGK